MCQPVPKLRDRRMPHFDTIPYLWQAQGPPFDKFRVTPTKILIYQNTNLLFPYIYFLIKILLHEYRL